MTKQVAVFCEAVGSSVTYHLVFVSPSQPYFPSCDSPGIVLLIMCWHIRFALDYFLQHLGQGSLQDLLCLFKCIFYI